MGEVSSAMALHLDRQGTRQQVVRIMYAFNCTLTPRQSEVLYWLTCGFSNKQIANEMFITEKTIKFHLTDIYHKISVNSRSEAIVKTISVSGLPEVVQKQFPKVEFKDEQLPRGTECQK